MNLFPTNSTFSNQIDYKIDELLAKRTRFGAAIYSILYFSIGLGTRILQDHPRQSVMLGILIVVFGSFRFFTSLSLHNWHLRRSLWRIFFYSGVLLTSATWGYFCYLTVQFYGVGETTFIVLFPTAGIAAGSILSFAPLAPLIGAHLLLLLGPTIVTLFMNQQGQSSEIFGILTTIYLVYLFLQSKKICEAVLDDLKKTQIIVDQKIDLLAEKEKTLAASKTKERFLAMMSHEIRTPLNGILGASDLILAEHSNPKLIEQVGIIRTGGENLLLILNDILDFSEMTRSQFDFENNPFDLFQCVGEAVGLFESVAQRKHLSLKHYVDPKVPRQFVGDASRLKQVLVNIIGNAVKFTDKGEIVITVGGQLKALEVYQLSFSVADTGVGIGESDLSKIFELFSIGDESNQRKFGGAGLGLAVCKKICQMMGGEIHVKSDLGKGSTFNFSVLLRTMSASKLRPAITLSGNQTKAKQYRVLSVDDHVANQKVVAAYLSRGGYIVDTAMNGVDAVEAARKTTYDAILMDCQMPEMDGFEATRKIREAEVLRCVPIIAITANALEGDREKCLKAGMDDYLSKPVRFPALMKVLNKWVKEPESQRRSA